MLADSWFLSLRVFRKIQVKAIIRSNLKGFRLLSSLPFVFGVIGFTLYD